VGGIRSLVGGCNAWADLAEGSLKEQTNALAEAVGGPWQTPNEARKELGMSPHPDGDRLYPPKATPSGGAA
jgi:hypothetical protein